TLLAQSECDGREGARLRQAAQWHLPIPPQRNVARFGEAKEYGWSEDKLRTNRWPSREYSACQISFRGPRNGDRARADRRHAPIGAVSAIGCEHARKLNDRGQSIRNEYGTCSSGRAR